jgi:hypothetical protein
MSHAVATLNRFLWFLLQTIAVGGIGFLYFAVGIAIVAIIMWATCPDQKAPDRGSFWELLWLPAIWIFVGLWGAWFWYEWEFGKPPNPGWVFYAHKAAPFVMILVAAYLIWRLRGARLFVATFAVANFYFLLVMWFLAGMAISGDWL